MRLAIAGVAVRQGCWTWIATERCRLGPRPASCDQCLVVRRGGVCAVVVREYGKGYRLRGEIYG